MGQVAVRFQDSEFDAAVGTVIQLKPAANAKPPLAVVPSGAEATSALGMIARAASLLMAQKERADLMEKRSVSAEEQLKVANRRLADAEIKLNAALDDVKTERARAADMQRRSNHVIEKTRAMLNEAGERLRDAESRAARAETSYASIRGAVEAQLAPHIA